MKIFSRKLFVTLTALGAGVGLALSGHLTSDATTLLIGVSSAYMAGNAAARFAGTSKSAPKGGEDCVEEQLNLDL